MSSVRILVGLVAAGLALAGANLKPGRRTEVVPSPPSEITVPAGWFLMGTTDKAARRLLASFPGEVRKHLETHLKTALAQEVPQRRIYLSAFLIDRLEVTRASYDRCVKARACPRVPRPSRLGAFRRSDAPMVNVTWAEAAAYCRFVGGRLPTEAEWEKAARGPFGRQWPWGDRWQERACNHGAIHPVEDLFHGSKSDGFYWVAPVGRFPFDRSYYGVLDLGGNVAEWVADWYRPRWWQKGPVPAYNPKGPSGGIGRLVKGGSWSRLRLLSRPAARRPVSPKKRNPDVGFRCVRDARRGRRQGPRMHPPGPRMRPPGPRMRPPGPRMRPPGLRMRPPGLRPASPPRRRHRSRPAGS